MMTAILESGRLQRFFILSVIAGLLVGCSGMKPFDYTEMHEIQPGPGLISGADGEFVLFTRDDANTGE